MEFEVISVTLPLIASEAIPLTVGVVFSSFKGTNSSGKGGSFKYHFAGLSKHAATNECKHIALRIKIAYLQPYICIKKPISRGIQIVPRPVKDMPIPIALPLFSLKKEFMASVKAAMTAAMPVAESKDIYFIIFYNQSDF